MNEPALMRLGDSERSLSIEVLLLQPYALRVLDIEGINTVGQLIDAAAVGFSIKTRPTSRTVKDVPRVLAALARATSRRCGIDWEAFAETMGCPFLPAYNGSDFRRAFKAAMREAVRLAFPSVQARFFNQYYLGAADVSMSQAAKDVGISRQMAWAVADSTVATLKAAIFEGKYARRGFYFRRSFVTGFREIRQRLLARHNHLPYRDAARIMRATVGSDPRDLGSAERLLWAVFDCRVVSESPDNIAVLVPREKEVGRFRESLHRAQNILRVDYPKGLTKDELARRLGFEIRATADRAEFSFLLRALKGIERNWRTKIVRAAMDRLTRLPDQAEIILRRRGEPMRGGELAEEIRKYRGRPNAIRTDENVRRLLSHDRRFEPIGKSGVWVLAEWEVERRSIISILVDALRAAKRAMTIRELYEIVAAKRPAARNSISKLLGCDDRVARVKMGVWRLK